MRAFRILLVVAACIGVPAHAQFNQVPAFPPAEAELIIEDARILTPTGWASAMAIADGVILAIGDTATVEAHRVAATRVLDLDGRMVMPGLHDLHVHPMSGGLSQTSCDIPHGSDAATALAIVRRCVGAAEPGEWITGGGYDNASLGTPPTRAMLDAVAPDNPVILRDISFHSAWVNSRALALAGVAATTPDPEGGIIERTLTGEPTGILRESAATLVASRVPEVTVEEGAEALSWALNEMLAHGITALEDAGVSETTARSYGLLEQRGQLRQRIRGCLWGSDPAIIDRHMEFATDHFSPTCVKLALDGVPTDGHTGALVDPYVDTPHGDHGQTDRARGLLMIPQPELDRMVTALDRRGFTIKFHAAGDAAVRAGLNAVEAARAANGFSGQYHNIAHNSLVQPSDIPRAREIFATFEFSPYIWYPVPLIADVRRAVGEERMLRWMPIREALDAGALVVPGSDWSVVPSVNPWIAMETLVTRQVPGGGGEVLGASQRITLSEAVDIFTRQAAMQMGNGHATGTLERGKLADMIVLDQNIFEVPITDVHATRVLMVFIDGELVHSVQ